jgi:hypothetical protein
MASPLLTHAFSASTSEWPFDWLMSTDLNAVPITHPAQKQGAG